METTTTAAELKILREFGILYPHEAPNTIGRRALGKKWDRLLGEHHTTAVQVIDYGREIGGAR